MVIVVIGALGGYKCRRLSGGFLVSRTRCSGFLAVVMRARARRGRAGEGRRLKVLAERPRQAADKSFVGAATEQVAAQVVKGALRVRADGRARWWYADDAEAGRFPVYGTRTTARTSFPGCCGKGVTRSTATSRVPRSTTAITTSGITTATTARHADRSHGGPHETEPSSRTTEAAGSGSYLISTASMSCRAVRA